MQASDPCIPRVVTDVTYTTGPDVSLSDVADSNTRVQAVLSGGCTTAIGISSYVWIAITADPAASCPDATQQISAAVLASGGTVDACVLGSYPKEWIPVIPPPTQGHKLSGGLIALIVLLALLFCCCAPLAAWLYRRVRYLYKSLLAQATHERPQCMAVGPCMCQNVAHSVRGVVCCVSTET